MEEDDDKEKHTPLLMSSIFSSTNAGGVTTEIDETKHMEGLSAFINNNR